MVTSFKRRLPARQSEKRRVGLVQQQVLPPEPDDCRSNMSSRVLWMGGCPAETGSKTEAAPSVFLDPSAFAYVVGVDIGSETCCFTVLTPQKQVVIKPSDLANAASGFEHLQERLTGLGEHPARIVVGM